MAIPTAVAGPRRRIVRANGISLAVDLADGSGAWAYFVEPPRPSWVMARLLVQGSCCADIGANVGLYTCSIARLIGPHGRVLAVEPHPRAFQSLLASIAQSGIADRVHPEQLALSRQRGTAMLHLSQESQHSSLIHPVGTPVRVPTDTLDALAVTHSFDQFDFVKIDVEGASADVVAGASRLLRDHAIRALLVELRAGQSPQPLLEADGYTGYLVDEPAQRLVPMSEVAPGHWGDYVFLAPTASAAFRRLGLR